MFMLFIYKEYIYRLAVLKSKRSLPPDTESVTSTRGLSASAQLSADVGKASADTSAAVDSDKVGPAAKQARRTTLTGRRQRDNINDNVKLEAAVSVVAEETVSKQSIKDNVRTPQNCKISVNIFVFGPGRVPKRYDGCSCCCSCCYYPFSINA